MSALLAKPGEIIVYILKTNYPLTVLIINVEFKNFYLPTLKIRSI